MKGCRDKMMHSDAWHSPMRHSYMPLAEQPLDLHKSNRRKTSVPKGQPGNHPQKGRRPVQGSFHRKGTHHTHAACLSPFPMVQVCPSGTVYTSLDVSFNPVQLYAGKAVRRALVTRRQPSATVP